MKLYVLEKTQEIPIGIQEAWDFFSSPKNLKTITPDYMGFDIVTDPLPDKMYSGQLIEYRVKPLLGIPMKWITEIKNVEEGHYFIDEQRSGPYRFWYHEHWFEEANGQTLMRDKVTYGLPLGLMGRMANAMFVRKQLNEIFSYRKQKVDVLFG